MNSIRLPRGQKRNIVTLTLSLLLAALTVVTAMLFPYLQHKNNTYIDMTPEGLYTLSEAMKNEIREVNAPVEILFLIPEGRLLDHELLRYVYLMARDLADENPSITVRAESLADNPTAFDDFRDARGTTLNATDVIVHSGERYKILSADSFFGKEDGDYVTYNGEYRIASAILSVTTYGDGPLALFAVGHGERYFVEGDAGSDPSLSAFADLLREGGLRVGKIALDEVDEIPEDCVLLIFCGTKEDDSAGDIYDYDAPSSLKKLDRFLFSKHSVMVLREGGDEPLPDFEDYLASWGIGFTSTTVTAPTESLSGGPLDSAGDRLIATYPDKSADAPAYEMVKDIASLQTPPKTVLANAMALTSTFRKNPVYTSESTSRAICPLFYAGASAEAKDAEGHTVFAKGSCPPIAMISIEATLVGAEHRMSYVLASGSTELISNDYLADTAFGNADAMRSVLRAITRTDVFASGEVGGFDMNATAYGGKWYEDTQLTNEGSVNTVFYSMTEYEDFAVVTTARVVAVAIAIFLVPVLVLPLCGVIVLRRRKNR